MAKLRLFDPPPYSPDLNPEELVWDHLQNHKLGREVIKGQEHLREKTLSILRSLQRIPAKIVSFFKAPKLPYALIYCPEDNYLPHACGAEVDLVNNGRLSLYPLDFSDVVLWRSPFSLFVQVRRQGHHIFWAPNRLEKNASVLPNPTKISDPSYHPIGSYNASHYNTPISASNRAKSANNSQNRGKKLALSNQVKTSTP
jgi:hypothetical protein